MSTYYKTVKYRWILILALVSAVYVSVVCSYETGSAAPAQVFVPDDAAGLRLLILQKYDKALEQFRLAAKLAPCNPEPLNLEGISLTLLGRREEADRAFQKALELDPDFWVARRELAANYLHDGKTKEAANQLTEVLELAPDDQTANFLFGQISYAQQDCPSALDHFGRAGPREGQVPVELMVAECDIATGQVETARSVLDRIKAEPALELLSRFKLGWLWGRIGEYEEAINAFNSLPANYPDPASRGYALALAYSGAGHDVECAEILKGLIARGHERSDIDALLGVSDDRLDRPEDAYMAFQNALRLDPHDEENFLNLANFCARTAQYDLALQYASQGIQALPESYRLYLCRGLLLEEREQWTQADADYHKAHELAPRAPEVFQSLALLYIEEGQLNEAVRILEDANRMAPNPGNDYLLAETFIRQGAASSSSNQYHQAIQALDACLDLDSKFVYCYFDRGKLKFTAGDVDGAIADLEKARALKPNATDIIYKLAEAYRRAGRKEAAGLFAERQAMGRKDLDDYGRFMLNVLATHH